MSPSAQLADKVSGLLASRFSRRGFFARSAVVGSAVAASPVAYALTPTDAYAAVCNCNNSSCQCGSLCCDGYTEFCCTLSGFNQCPPGSLLGGWWKVDGSGFCNGPRYYMDCNAPCNGCGCGGNGVCSGGCSGTGCGCALGDCNNRKAGCTQFRYGQCNQQISCIGPIICRVVTCIAPWEVDGTCTTTARYDAATAFHDRPCLHKVIGNVTSAEEHRPFGLSGIRVQGWAVDYDTNAPVGVSVYMDGNFVTTVTADRPRSDVAATFPGQGPNHGFDVTIAAGPGSHSVCVYALNTGPSGNGNPSIGCRSVRVGSPFGALEGYSTGPGNVTVRGWAIDPDTTGPVDVHVYVDGRGAGLGTADLPRPDIGAAYPGFGDRHGYSITAGLPPGPHQVCTYGINVGSGNGNPILGCTTVVGGNPYGFLDSVEPSAGSIRATGWAIDPDQIGSPIQVRLLLDGALVATVAADQPRPDVGRAFPDAGPNHGFERVVDAAPGVHTLSAVAVNVGPGNDVPLATRTVEVRTGSPFGFLDDVYTGPDRIRVEGWVIDPDTTGPIQVQVSVDGVVQGTGVADRSRPDVGAVFPGYGAVHGYQVDVPAGTGLRIVRVVATNVGPGGPVELGVRQVLVGGNPFGYIDETGVAFGQVGVKGWAIDPDTDGPAEVHMYVDGRGAAVVRADQPRPDLSGSFPLFGPDHGFTAVAPITPGTHQVCLYAINQGSGGENVLLGCRTVQA